MRLLALCLAALALAAPAGGGAGREPAGELLVLPLDPRPGVAAETDVDLSLGGPDATPIASVETYVPSGYRVAPTGPAGRYVGTATVFIADRAAPISAALLTADRAGRARDACARGGRTAVWTAAVRGFRFTVLVDATSGRERERGAYRLVYCLPPRLGVVDVDLDLLAALRNPPRGVRTWRALVTPSRGPAFELRSVVATPQTLTLRTAYSPSTGLLTLRGRLLFAGLPRPGVDVHIALAARADLADARELGVARTRSDGTYSLSRPVARRHAARRLTATAYVNFYAGACSERPLAPGGCASSIAPPPSALVPVDVPRR